jgi:hypothetical protein
MPTEIKDTPKTAKETAQGRFKVRLSHPQENGRTVFSTVSESRARNHIAQHYPRGSEAYLELPDGSTEHYEAERAGERGQDTSPWAPFDPSSFQVPSEAVAPGESEWADKEG